MITISTTRLQALLNKAVKGAGLDKNITKTTLVEIKLENGVLTLTTTDDTNYLTLKTALEGDDFYVAVPVDILYKLVGKMTCENVTLEVTDACLNVIGNGKYPIALDTEDDGTLVKLTNPISSFDKSKKIGVIEATDVLKALTSVKPALATEKDFPWFTCYYVGDSITGTDSYIMSNYVPDNKPLEEPKLISATVMDLLGLFSGTITVYMDGEAMLFESEDGSVYGAIPSGIEHYSIDLINDFIQQEYEYSCKVVKSSLLKLLDRIALFVGVYEDGAVSLSFDAEGLTVDSAYASESIAYADDSGVGDFTCRTDVATLLTQVKAQDGDEIIIQYGKENAIKIIDGKVTSVVALLE